MSQKKFECKRITRWLRKGSANGTIVLKGLRPNVAFRLHSIACSLMLNVDDFKTKSIVKGSEKVVSRLFRGNSKNLQLKKFQYFLPFFLSLRPNFLFKIRNL